MFKYFWFAWLALSVDISGIAYAADESNVFLFNSIEQCKATEYFDVNYFACKQCDESMNLMPSESGECAGGKEMVVEERGFWANGGVIPNQSVINRAPTSALS